MIKKFMDWFESAPLYASVWFMPIVILLGIVAIIKNKTGECMKTKINISEFVSSLLSAMASSVLDMVISASVTGATLSVIFKVAHPYYLQFIPGLYIIAMLLMLCIRITHSFDDSYTVDELGKKLEYMQAQLDRLERNA